MESDSENEETSSAVENRRKYISSAEDLKSYGWGGTCHHV
jgi:hypothetical protein